MYIIPNIRINKKKPRKRYYGAVLWFRQILGAVYLQYTYGTHVAMLIPGLTCQNKILNIFRKNLNLAPSVLAVFSTQGTEGVIIYYLNCIAPQDK